MVHPGTDHQLSGEIGVYPTSGFVAPLPTLRHNPTEAGLQEAFGRLERQVPILVCRRVSY